MHVLSSERVCSFLRHTGELIGLDLLGTQSELGVPTELELVDAAIDQLTDRPVEAEAAADEDARPLDNSWRRPRQRPSSPTSPIAAATPTKR